MSHKQAKRIRKYMKKIGQDWRNNRKLYKRMKKKFYQKRGGYYGNKTS